MIKHQPVLQWVIVSGEKRHVSDFSHLKPNQRPEAFCPICERSVIMHLGPVRVHHVVHSAGSICIATQPETALHINTKHYLQQELQKSNELYLCQFCNGPSKEAMRYSYPCHDRNKRSVLFAKNWNRVEVEWQFGPYRLDVAMLDGDKVVGAIEVLVTHKTENEKKKYLKSQNVPWVEIRTDEEFYTGDNAWTFSKPLIAEDYNKNIVDKWFCESCIALVKDYHQKQKEEKEYQEKQKRKQAFAQKFDVLFARYVDFHYSSLKKYRATYIIQTKTENGKIVYADLQEIGTQRRQIAIERPPITEESLSRLKQALKSELSQKEKQGIILNRSFNWVETPKFHPKMFIHSYRYPYLYEKGDGKWEKAKTREAPRLRKKNHQGYRFFSSDEIEEKSKDKKTTQKAELTCVECGQYTSDWSVKYGDSKTCLCRECVVRKHRSQR